jgi:hypothetical protein
MSIYIYIYIYYPFLSHHIVSHLILYVIYVDMSGSLHLVVGPPDLGPLRLVPALSEVGGEIILARVPWVGVNCKVLQSF